MRRIKRQKGLSLVEVTIILLVLMLLTSVLAPSIWDFVHDAQWVKVKEDCEVIGITFSRLVRDIGPCLRQNHVWTCTLADRVDVLQSDGAVSTDLGGVFTSPYMVTQGWNATNHNLDTMANQFILNAPQYNTPFQNYAPLGVYPVGPMYNLGWRGAYISSPIGPDPWGSKYYLNSGFMATAIDASGLGEGSTAWWWERDVFCLSPGPNQIVETPYGGPPPYGNYRSGDDFVFVVSGSGR